MSKIDIRGMFDTGRNEMTLVGINRQCAVDYRIVAFRSTTGKNNLSRICINEGGNLPASVLKMVRHLMTKRISA
jgi:hypothetical protein